MQKDLEPETRTTTDVAHATNTPAARAAMRREHMKAVRKDLFPDMLMRCATIGAGPGAVSSMVLYVAIWTSAYCPPQHDTIPVDAVVSLVFLPFASGIGALVGIVLGLITGVVVAGETCFHFPPPYDTARYRRMITSQCLAVVLTAAALALRYLAHHDDIRIMITTTVTTYACAGLSALWGANKIVKWYGGY